MPFEDELGAALRRTADSFSVDQQRLAGTGLTRGRRVRQRRRAALAGGVAVLSLVGVGGAWAGGLLDRDSGSGASVAGEKRHDTYDEGWMTGTLKRLLPDAGRAGEFGGRGTEPVAGKHESPFAVAVYDDGGGKATVGVYVSRPRAGSAEFDRAVSCPDKSQASFDACRTERLADGSALMTLEGSHLNRSIRPKEFKEWHVVLRTPQGLVVDATARNSYLPKGVKPARATPSLTVAQLRTVATDQAWRQLADGIVSALSQN
ncbi:hypothetical protein ACFYVL_27640 [Streptomyces sp. NPDC004111]|uniref:hypothetical protein n=1 Tax=Streptomyces sp. NPDC004111 TaxID=3364690 RepID=UPI00367BD5C1